MKNVLRHVLLLQWNFSTFNDLNSFRWLRVVINKKCQTALSKRLYTQILQAFNMIQLIFETEDTKDNKCLPLPVILRFYFLPCFVVISLAYL